MTPATDGVPAADNPRTITEPMKANWAVAYARQHVRGYLNPALRRAYQKDGSPPEPDALRAAITEARSVLAALEGGLRLLERDASLPPADRAGDGRNDDEDRSVVCDERR